jgi:hypothetical protein
MMLESFDYAQLNPEAKQYLADVRRINGRGAPGIYQAVSDKRPYWALGVGICVLPLFLWIGYTSSKAPWATALLQTAGILLGGWLIWFGIRRWVVNTENFGGYFYYFDADHAFIGSGERLSLARIPPDAEVVPKGPLSLRVSTEMDEFRVPVPSRPFADQVADYYHALAWVRDREDGPFFDLDIDEAGAVAKYMAEENQAPPNVTEADLRIDSTTDLIRPKGNPKSGVMNLLIWFGIAAAAYAVFMSTNGIFQDNMAFANARDNLGKNSQDKVTGGQGLRDYLLNERNTRNREEAKQLLAKLYDAPIAAVKGNPDSDPQLRDGMIALLESLRSPETPAVSISVTDTNSTGSNYERGLRSRFADGLATAIGKDLIVFGEAPTDKPALLKIVYETNAGGKLIWTVEVRVKPDDSTVYKSSGVVEGFINNPFQSPQFNMGTVELETSETDSRAEAIYAAVMMKMMGTAPAKPAVVTNDDW